MKAAPALARIGAVAALCWLAGTMSHAVSMHSTPTAPVPLGTQDTCSAYDGRPALVVGQPTGMVHVPAGRYTPGSQQGYADERPAGEVRVAAFWIDRTEVSNAQFADFVNAMGYVTEAERQGAAAVFRAPANAEEIQGDGSWWHYVKGANWRHPEGPDSDLRGREHDPVVQVTLADALAYAHWMGRDLPTEAEWEYAARANGRPELLDRAPRDAQGRPTANFWQGVFPELNSREDGYAGRSPVGCFPANGFGLYDMIGNVWEWTRDEYAGPRQPHGSSDPYASVRETDVAMAPGRPMLIKGGSFLCARDYCARYRASARYPQEANLGAAHVGFRTVLRASAS